MENLRFGDGLPAERVFPQGAAEGSGMTRIPTVSLHGLHQLEMDCKEGGG
jgi:hypothetical protein